MKSVAIRLFTLSIFLTVYIVLTLTFWIAWTSPEKAVKVTINSYNEAGIELFLLLGSLGPVLYGTLCFLSDTLKNLEVKKQKV
ncbi:MAG: hypothetical protein DRP12_03005 [Candidatus Aenigmatarchaeota archaeon]|nr:MAG: hypothetical protein DRP12_03005 [Candidatus Aenigmarchaeota archaeon]